MLFRSARASSDPERPGQPTPPRDSGFQARGTRGEELTIEPDPGMASHFFISLAQAGRMAIHVEASGRDAHHVAEAAYKAVGRALRVALRQESAGIPSTKGLL